MFQANDLSTACWHQALRWCNLGRPRTAWIAGFSLVLSCAAQAQTILDYSRAQRAVLEAEMAKNSAKALGGPSPAAPRPATPSFLSTPPPGAAQPAVMDAPRPAALAVNGVIALSSRSVAEVQVSGVTHYLREGDAVPGTPWRVSAVSSQRVTLSQGTDRRPVTRIFDLTPR